MLTRTPRIAAVTLAALGFMTLPAHAINLTQPSYTHFSAAYIDSNRAQGGLFFDMELELDHKFFVHGTYQQARYRRSSGATFRESVADIGAGRYFTISDGVTWDVSASVGRISNSGNLFSTGNNFHTLNTGFRHRFDAFETRIGYRYIKQEGLDAAHGAVASGWWYFAPQMSVGVTYSNVYNRSAWGFGTRILF
ncbi:MAG: hypothetical protein JJU10_06495 [Idiomarina sp.]|nr:hypothetical protein [Idiomarina sp.]